MKSDSDTPLDPFLGMVYQATLCFSTVQRKKNIFGMKLLKKAKGVQQISKEFAYPSYFKDTIMGLLGGSSYKIFVGNYTRYKVSLRQNDQSDWIKVIYF